MFVKISQIITTQITWQEKTYHHRSAEEYEKKWLLTNFESRKIEVHGRSRPFSKNFKICVDQLYAKGKGENAILLSLGEFGTTEGVGWSYKNSYQQIYGLILMGVEIQNWIVLPEENE